MKIVNTSARVSCRLPDAASRVWLWRCRGSVPVAFTADGVASDLALPLMPPVKMAALPERRGAITDPGAAAAYVTGWLASSSPRR
ncbi:MAG: hypothetical protein IPH80_19245 [Myxococcales bacterium]|nr:hypothetical protein [Myxococcales bacterium]